MQTAPNLCPINMTQDIPLVATYKYLGFPVATSTKKVVNNAIKRIKGSVYLSFKSIKTLGIQAKYKALSSFVFAHYLYQLTPLVKVGAFTKQQVDSF